ncbi:EAL domain-containing protein [Edaphobacter sp. HDX4]|uniref:EAL domain-containing protein n=1 Tax=Edaphobacter sp. HDX4 TaxID=2794064 RepID=UPI002FE65046
MRVELCATQGIFLSEAWKGIEAVLDAMPVPICLLQAGSVSYVNLALVRLLGIERGLIVGQPFSALSSSGFADKLSSGISAGGVGSLLLKGANGDLIGVGATAHLIEIESIQLLQVSFTVSDDQFPTDVRKQLLHEMMGSTRDCLKILELDGTIRWMNSHSQQRLGFQTVQELLGATWIDFWNGESRLAAKEALEVARAGGHGRFEGNLHPTGGENTWWDVSVSPIKSNSGEPEALLVVSRNITDRKLAEAEVMQKSRHLQIIVNLVPALIAYVDANGHYQWINHGYQTWYGLSAADMVGHHWYGVLAERVGREYAEQLRPRVEAALTGVPQTFEATHQFGGQTHGLILSYAPDLDEEGRMRGFVVLATDMTEQRRAREELFTSQERFRTLAETLPSIVWTASPEGEVEYLSDRFREITGLTIEDGQGSNWTRVIHPDDLPDTIGQWRQALSVGISFDEKYRIRQRDGSYRWYLARALPQRNEAGEILRWVGVTADVHQQTLAEEAIRQSERRYRLLFEDNPLPMWTYDCETLRFLSVNDKAVRSYGYSREEFLSMRVSDIRPQEDLPQVLTLLHDPKSGEIVGPFRHLRKDGSIFWAEVTGHDISHEGDNVRLVVAQDVTERVRLNEELLHRVDHDPLTGLPNRRLLADRFEQARRRADRSRHKAVLLIIDFDHFKQVNDTFGHQIGDEFLKAATQRIRARLRSTDTLARLGGDEFIAIADEVTSLESCATIAQNLMEALQDPFTIMDVQLQHTISLGLAIYPDDGSNLDDLLRLADYGLYEAKRAGRNCCKRYHRSEGYDIEEARQIERSLRSAVKEDRLVLHYQPMFSPTGEIKGLEALIRLVDSHHGLLSPNRFISIAEESGLIHSIGLWALREACRQSRQWRDQGFDPLPVAVNVSASQFLRGNLATDVSQTLNDFSIEPEMLELELTESLLMENTEEARQQLRTLKQIGVRISMDDFGTGYSSLSYLHTLPIDILKIDRSFVQKIRGTKSDPIVTAIVELGKHLGLTVVAEGVETNEQHQELVHLGCDLFQGFLLSSPRPANEIEHLMQRTSPEVSRHYPPTISGTPAGPHARSLRIPSA